MNTREMRTCCYVLRPVHVMVAFLKKILLSVEQIKVEENDKNSVKHDSVIQLFSFSKAILLHFKDFHV